MQNKQKYLRRKIKTNFICMCTLNNAFSKYHLLYKWYTSFILCTALFVSFHGFSIGFRSKLWLGRSKLLIFFRRRIRGTITNCKQESHSKSRPCIRKQISCLVTSSAKFSWSPMSLVSSDIILTFPGRKWRIKWREGHNTEMVSSNIWLTGRGPEKWS